MRRLWISIAVLMFAAVGHAGKAEAGYYSGDEILKACEGDSVADRNICYVYLAGIVDVTSTYDGWGDLSKGFCIPDGASLGQLRKVAIKGFNERPEKLHLGASGIVANILFRAFPCD